MKITLFLLLLSVFQLQAINSYGQITKLSIETRGADLTEIFKNIEKQSEFLFNYIDTDVAGIKANVDVKNGNIEEILSQSLRNTGLTYIINDRHITISKQHQQAGDVDKKITVTGIIRDDKQQPLVGVSVSIKGTSTGVASDVDGKYSISIPNEQTILVFAYVGYVPQEIKVGNKKEIPVSMVEDQNLLEEVVVVGYGTVKKGNLTTAVSTIHADVLENRPSQTVSDVLQGTVPGLSVTASGRPGQAASMQLRGATSLNAGGTPLVLIDGVPGEFNYMNVDDIETVTVLKDAASAAIYGSRAAHGVILISTKRGKSGKPVFKYSGYAGLNTPTDMPEMVSSATYAKVRNEAEFNIGRTAIYNNDVISKFVSGEDPNRYPNTNWIDMMFKNSFTTRQSLAATGGSENTKYYVGAGYDHQTGVIEEVSQDVFNVRSNVDVSITKKFNLSFDLRYILREKDEVSGFDGIITDIYKMNPTYLAYYTDGTFAYNPNAIINPMAYLHETSHQAYDNHDASGIFKLSYEFIDGLKLTGLANVNYVFTKTKTPGRKYYITDYFTKNEYSVGQNTLTENRGSSSYYNLQALLTYTKTLAGKHNIDLLAGYQQENQESDWISGYRDGYPTDIIQVLDGGSKDNWTNGGSADHWAIASFIGRINYDYAGKYILTFNVRSDGSSRFSRGNRWSTFPSISGAWRITGEDFMKGTSSVLNDLKIRASWGKTGASSGIGLYPSFTTIAMGGVVLNNTYITTAYLNVLGNKNLQWEKTTMFDPGFDALFLKSRLGVSFDYYNKKTDDILIALPVPMEFGFGKPSVNIGSVQNTGYEVDIKWNDRIGDVNYNIQANFSDNKNKVLDIGGTAPWISGSSYTAVGYPMNSIYGYRAQGMFQTADEIKNSPFQNVNNKPGDIKYVNQNTDTKIDGNDRVVLGDPYPHYLYGLRLAADYKGFDVSMFFQGVGKKDYIMNGPGIQPLTDGGKGPVFSHQLDYWTTDNPNAKYPRILDSSQGAFNYQTSDFWKINAGYFRMKNLQIGYNFTKQLLKNTGFSQLRLYLSANNLFTIDNFVPGYDPETSSAYTYPLSRTYTVGLNVQF